MSAPALNVGFELIERGRVTVGAEVLEIHPSRQENADDLIRIVSLSCSYERGSL